MIIPPIEKRDYIYPEEKIQLLNGDEIVCYPLPQFKDEVDNKLKLGTTGTYLSVGKQKQPVATPEIDKEKEEERKLFLDNAFLLLQNKDKILSDSLMFLCPIPIQSGVAYIGTSGFRNPTLGVYIEWWLNCGSAMITEEDDSRWLVYQIAGSPLSGSNRCGLVNADGVTKAEYVSNFSSLRSSFMKINTRYDEAKSKYQAYSLKEVVEIIDAERDDKETQIIFLKGALQLQHTKMMNEKKYWQREVDMLRFHLMYAHKPELEAFMEDYTKREEQKLQREKEIDDECKELRGQLKSGEIDNKQYQKRLTPLKKERVENSFDLNSYCWDEIKKIFPGIGISLESIKDFLKDPRSSEPLDKAFSIFYSPVK